MMVANRKIYLIDTLYNLSEKSGSSTDYGRGVLVGVVCTLMAQGRTLQQAVAEVKKYLPEDWRLECIPSSWQEDFK